jgi:single-strand DNA-binding protein
MSLATISLVGHLGRDAELRYSPTGSPIVTFSLAVSRRPRVESDDEHTDWFNVSLFGPRAEAVAHYLTKGKLVAVVGRFSHREYTRRDGTRGCALEVIANEVELANPASGARTGERVAAPVGAGSQAAAPADAEIEDTPF